MEVAANFWHGAKLGLRWAFGAAGLACLAVTGAAAQQAARHITIIVPFAAGGGSDVIARTIAEPLQQRLGQTVIIDNKPGASGNLGTQAVARAAADGHTLLFTADPTFTANISLMKNAPYHPISDFAPIIEATAGTMVLVVHNSMPVTSTQEFLAYAKARPGEINYGSAGVGTPHHLTMEFLKLTAQVKLTHIPFRDTAGANTNLIGGHVTAMFLPLNVALPLPQDKVRLLAVTSRERTAAAPTLPTFVEQGFSEFESTLSFGFLAPAGTPRDVVVRYNAAFNEILRSPQVAAKLTTLGLMPTGGTPERYGESIAKDFVKWQKVIKEGAISIE
jgi:tripartite-type tricarboxylate transporter receptor subunit TctC